MDVAVALNHHLLGLYSSDCPHDDGKTLNWKYSHFLDASAAVGNQPEWGLSVLAMNDDVEEEVVVVVHHLRSFAVAFGVTVAGEGDAAAVAQHSLRTGKVWVMGF